MAVRMSVSRRRPVVTDVVLRPAICAAGAAFLLVGTAAVGAGISLETAAVRALVAAAVLGGAAAAAGFVLCAGSPARGPVTAAPPPRLRGQLVDVALPEEGA